MDWLKIFKKPDTTAKIAKDRLQIIVARERGACIDGGKPGSLAALQQELMQVIARYEEVDLDRVNVQIDKRGDTEVLELSIMVPDDEVQPPSKARSRLVYA